MHFYGKIPNKLKLKFNDSSVKMFITAFNKQNIFTRNQVVKV